MCARRFVQRQRQIGVDLAEEKPASGITIDQAGVLADPAQAGIARKRTL
jgi:hypothetical protein